MHLRNMILRGALYHIWFNWPHLIWGKAKEYSLTSEVWPAACMMDFVTSLRIFNFTLYNNCIHIILLGIIITDFIAISKKFRILQRRTPCGTHPDTEICENKTFVFTYVSALKCLGCVSFWNRITQVSITVMILLHMLFKHF